jgi:hypothetical protein
MLECFKYLRLEELSKNSRVLTCHPSLYLPGSSNSQQWLHSWRILYSLYSILYKQWKKLEAKVSEMGDVLAHC